MASIPIIVQPSDRPTAEKQTALLTGVTITGAEAPGGQDIISIGGSAGQNAGYYAGTAVLVNGQTAAPISVPKLDANSRCFFTQGPIGASSALGVQRQLNHQTPGTPGTLDLIVSIKADGTVETGDQSTIYWQVIELTQ